MFPTFKHINKKVSPLSSILIVIICSRIMVVLIAVLYLVLTRKFSLERFLHAFSQWDGQWYLRIMREGYHWSGPLIQSDVAFFPLYPLLGNILNLLIRNDALSLFIISNISFMFLCLILFKYISQYNNRSTAYKTVLYLCIFPISFVFSSLYTESLFLLLVVSSFYFIEKDKYLLSSSMACLASLTRFSGIVLFPVLTYFLYTRKRINQNMWWFILSPLGLLFYIIYLQFKVGDGLAFYKSLAAWQIMTVPPWILIWEIIKTILLLPQTSHFFPIAIFDLAVIIIFLVLFYISFKYLPKHLLLFTFLIFFLSLTKMWNPSFFYAGGSVSRYLLEAFPVFVTLAILGKKPAINYIYIILSLLLIPWLAASFFNGLWVF